MTIKTSWENDEKQVIVSVYTGLWGLDEFYQAVETCNRLMDSVDYPVNLILDMSKSTTLPNGFMGAIRSLSQKPHANMGIMAIVGANKLVKIFTDLIAKVYRGRAARKSYMVQTYEEAHEIFKQRALEPVE